MAAYFAREGIRRLMHDVLSSRELTQRAIADAFRWSLAQTLPERSDLLETEEPDELIAAMGGMYELVYTYLVREKALNVAAITLPSVLVFGTMLGVPEPPGGISAYALAPDELRALAQRAVRRIAW